MRHTAIICRSAAHRQRSSVVVWGTAILAICSTTLQGESPLFDLSNRLTVAVLPFEDTTGDPNLAPWRYMVSGLLKNQLADVKSLRIRSEEAVNYGLRKVGVSPGDAIDPNMARAIGEHIEAQRVIWGVCHNVGGRLRIEARMLNVATNELSGPFISSGVDAFDLRDALSEQILRVPFASCLRTQND